VPLKKVEVRHTKDGKGSGLFAMEDIDKDDYVTEYVGNIEYKRRENNYMMNINEMNLWINRGKWWTFTIHESLMQSKL
jgi:SET domain-containing protein